VIHQQLKSSKADFAFAGGVIGSYFFLNDNSDTITVNGMHYRSMLIFLALNW